MSLRSFINDYAAALRGHGHTAGGVRSYIWQLERFFDWIGDNATIAHLTAKTITRYQAHMGAKNLAPGTIANSLTVIRSFCTWLIIEEHLTDDPTRRVRWPRETDIAPRALSHAELQQVWGLITAPNEGTTFQQWHEERNKRALAVMLLAGLRIAEAAALRWKDIDMHHRELTIWQGKGGRSRKVPINHQLLQILVLVRNPDPAHAVVGNRDGSRMGPKSLAHIFERWLKRQGIIASAHQLRHSFATELFRQDVHIRTIQTLLGHRNLETTMRYLSVDDERKRNAVNRLNGWNQNQIN